MIVFLLILTIMTFYIILFCSVITEFIDIYSKENFIKKFHDKSIILIKQKYEVLTIEDNLCVNFNNRIFSTYNIGIFGELTLRFDTYLWTNIFASCVF